MGIISYRINATKEDLVMPSQAANVEVGDEAPAFCLPDGLSGEETCLSDYLGSPVYLVFLRGSW
jgi:hypothetical protein